MIVRCIADTGDSLPQVNIDSRRGYDAATEFPLAVGREYQVYALTVFLGTAWYYVLDDDGNPWPTWVPSALFDVIDGRIPRSWIVGYVRHSIESQYPLLSFPEWATDEQFYERLVDREPRAVQVFADRRAEIEGVD